MKSISKHFVCMFLCCIFVLTLNQLGYAWEKTGSFQILENTEWVQNHGVYGVGYNAKLNKIYSSSIRTQGVTVINGATNKREKIIPVPPMENRPGLSNVRWSPVTDLVYMSAPDENKIYVIDPNEEKYLRDWSLPGGPRGIDIDRKTGNIFIPLYGESWEGGGNTVKIYDKNEKLLKTVTVEDRPWEISVDSDEGKTYVVCKGPDNYKQGYLCIIDNNSFNLTATIPIGRRPRVVGVNNETRKAYIACRFSSAVYVVDIDNHIVINKIPTDCDPIGIVVKKETNRIYCINRQGAMRLETPYRGTMSTVTIIDGNTDSVIKTVTHGKTGHYGVLNPRNGYIYMSTEDTNDIWMLNTNTDEIVGNVDLGLNMDSKYYLNPKTGYIYASSHVADKLTIMDGRGEKVIAIVPSHGGWPWGAAGLPNLNRIYTNNSDNGTLSVFDANTHKFIKNIEIGVDGHFSMNAPIVEAHTFLWSKIKADNKRNRLLVTCSGAEKLAVIDAKSEHVEFVDLGFTARLIDYSLLDPAINEDTNMIYVWNSMMATITVIDGETLRIVDLIDVPLKESNRSDRLIMDSINNRLYIGRYLIDCTTNLAIDMLPENIEGVATHFDETKNQLYVDGSRGSSVTILNGTTLGTVETIEFEAGSFQALDTVKERMYVHEGRGVMAVYTK